MDTTLVTTVSTTRLHDYETMHVLSIDLWRVHGPVYDLIACKRRTLLYTRGHSQQLFCSTAYAGRPTAAIDRSVVHREGNSVCPSREGDLCSLATHTLAPVVKQQTKGEKERTAGAMTDKRTRDSDVRRMTSRVQQQQQQQRQYDAS